jgi:hypothetical protein
MTFNLQTKDSKNLISLLYSLSLLDYLLFFGSHKNIRLPFFNAVKQNLSSTKLFTGLGQLHCINISSFSTTFDGALIPADFGTQKIKVVSF